MHGPIRLWLVCTCTSALLVAAPLLAADPGEEVVYAWDFAGVTDTLGWVALHSVRPLTVREGALVAAISGSDPYIASPPLDAETATNHLIRIIYRSTVGGTGEVFWAAAGEPEEAQFRAGESVGVRFAESSTWRVIHAAPTWQPGLHLTRLRIDFPEGVGQVVEIQRIELVARPVPPSLPEEPRYDFAQPGLGMAFMPGPGMGSVYSAGDALVCEPVGDPAVVYSPAFSLAAESAGIASMGIRVDGPSHVEVLFKRKGASLFPPGEGVGIKLGPSTDFRTINLDLRTVPAYQGEIERLALRIWPEGPVSRVEVRSLAVVDRPRGPAWLHIERALAPGVVASLGPTLTLECIVRNVGGRGTEGGQITVSPPTGVSTAEQIRVPVPAVPPLSRARVPVRIPMAAGFAGGWTDLAVDVTGGDSTVVRTLLVEVLGPEVTTSDPAPTGTAYLTPEGHAVMTNGQLTLVFPGTPQGFGTGVIVDASASPPVRVGSFPSLGLVTGPDGRVQRIYTQEYPVAASGPIGAQISFPVQVRFVEGERTGVVRFLLRPRASEVECTMTLDSGPEVALSGLVFPEFLAGDGALGPDREVAVFPGLEYLLPGEVSSAPTFVEPPDCLRFVPHPYKVTMPAMWITSGDETIGLRWEPIQDWSGRGLYPTPVFASPDRLLGAPSHRMGLLTPGVLGGGEENSLSLASPIRVPAGVPISLSAAVFRLPGADEETACRYVLKALAGSEEAKPPPLPEPAPDHEVLIERAAYGFARTLWIPEDRLWHPNLPDAFGPHYSAAYAHVLWYYSRMAPESPYAAMAEAVLREALAAQRERGGGVGWEMAFCLDGAGPAVEGVIAQGRALAGAVRLDGTWPYVGGSALRQSFGVDGDTSSGLVAVNALRCLEAAALSGDLECLEAGLLALAYLDTQRRPEGAQTWELPLHVPDILACAYAVRAHLLAYRLTSQLGQLASARKWAWRALPFIYVWSPPERPIMRYGSIPVLGATHFTSPWFGRIVQWNGLEVAEALLELADDDDSFDWRTVAEGILLSAGQQMRPITRDGFELAEYVPDTGHPGLYPDAYSAVLGTDAYTWDLEASRIARLAGRLRSDAGWPRTEVLRGEERVISLTGLAEIHEASVGASSVRTVLSLPPELGEHTVVFGRLREPQAVSVDGEAAVRLNPGVTMDQPSTYQWRPDSGLLLLRVPAGGPVEVVVSD